MAPDNLKAQATSGFLWSAIDKFGGQVAGFVISISVARLLMPEDYGLIGMLSVFTAIFGSFIDSGMSSGLIQKQDRSEIDYSTVFVFNLALSLSAYCILFFSAPYIASFYGKPELTLVTRVLSINLLLSSFTIVQDAKLKIAIDFKSLAKINLISMIVGGFVAIFMATTGFGVWSLVGQILSNTLTRLTLLWLISRWKPIFKFSRESFKRLFSFGARILFASIYSRFMEEIYNIFIGRNYLAKDLGFYTRSKNLTEIASLSITSVINQVSYPILSSLQSDRTRLIAVHRRMIRMAAFLIIPVMLLISILAEPLVIILLTEKWRPVIPLLQWMVFSRILYPMGNINLNLLNAIGRSDLFMKISFTKFPIMILALIVTVPLGIKEMVIGQAISTFIFFFINSYLPGRFYNYGSLRQLRDMAPMFGMALVMAAATWLSLLLVDSLIGKLVVGGLVGVLSYSALAYVAKVKEMEELVLIGKQIVGRYRSQ